MAYFMALELLRLTSPAEWKGEESGSPEFPMSFDFRLGLTHESHFLMPLGRIFRLGIWEIFHFSGMFDKDILITKSGRIIYVIFIDCKLDSE